MLFKVALKAFLTVECYELMLLFSSMSVPGLAKEPVVHVSPIL